MRALGARLSKDRRGFFVKKRHSCRQLFANALMAALLVADISRGWACEFALSGERGAIGTKEKAPDRTTGAGVDG
jgi:hypothetical protein